MVTQTPSSYEGEGEGLNFTREMIGIFNGEVELKFWTSNVPFSKKGKRFFALEILKNVGLGKYNRWF